MQKRLNEGTIVYQIYPRSFQDSDGDGIGDIRGIISRLDYLKELGINAIWLSPIYKSPDDDNGYDISDYCSIQPHFGTLQDFDELVAEAKARGIDIIMDLVINHTSDEHEWFRRALAGEEKYRDYYIIRKGKPDGSLPNNWGNFFAECPWTRLGDGDEYYLHLFSKKQPDLNFKNPAVIEEIKGIMKFWLDRGVAGFRCDVINVIYKNTLDDGKRSFILTGKEHYLSTDGCHEILKELRRECTQPYGAWTVGETVFVDESSARRLTDGELDMVFTFEHMEVDQIIVKWFKKKLRPGRLMRTLTKWQRVLPHGAIYFENHDQPRFISRLVGATGHHKAASKLVGALTLTLGGTPFIYEGQEIGMTGGDFKSLDEIQDIESHNVYALAKKLHIPRRMRMKMISRTSRDNARCPMQWTAEAGAGFTSGTPWLKINPNHSHINVEAQLKDSDSVLSFYKKMIELRRTHPALCRGSFTSLYESDKIYAYQRCVTSEQGLGIHSVFETVVILLNFTNKTVRLPGALMKYAEREPIISSTGGKGDRLMPFEARLVYGDIIL
ncbi:MAG: alpha-glucosidase [Clostridia bacterium]|nr:alpha-glucosidase [Clostridia bacterium]